MKINAIISYLYKTERKQMTVTAKVIAHSAHDGVPDLITLELRYPRFIHSEFLTHRAFSRNSSSSRAVPIEHMIADVEADLAMPVEWGSNKKGMQAGEEIAEKLAAKVGWEFAAIAAIYYAKKLSKLGLHKQIVNRIIEPFSHIETIVTATDWDNFFKLRLHKDADPTMRALAQAMRDSMDASTAKQLNADAYHMPYYNNIESSVAACARVSYLNHDGTTPDKNKDKSLYEHLLTNKHMSPFEHIAQPKPNTRHANLNGWRSLRSMIEIDSN